MAVEQRRRPRHLEATHQRALIQWAQLTRVPHNTDVEPGAVVGDYLFAIPNGGKRNAREAALMRAEGVKAGVSDLMLPLARRGWHGLWIELKAPGGSPTQAQREWAQRMDRAGYMTAVARGWHEARELIVAYLGIGARSQQQGGSSAEGSP